MTLIDEFDGSGNLKYVYAHGPNIDEPLFRWDIAAGTWGTLQADERGSIISLANSSGAATAINRYDEYGIPGSGNAGAFQYTGQMWLPELGMYHYRARIYSPTLGRFLQTDPIGFGGGMNIYAYVGSDPVNLADPSGLSPPVLYESCTGSRLCPVAQNGGYGGTYPLFCGSCSVSSMEGPSGDRQTITRWTLIDQNTGAFFGYKFNFGSIGGGGFGNGFGGAGLFLAANYSRYGPIFGDRATGARAGGPAETDKAGGFETALRDIDYLADLNGWPVLGMKGIVDGPPQGWVMLPIAAGGFRIRYIPGGLQIRVVQGRVQIDIGANTRIGPRLVSLHGEIVHYGR